MAMFGCGNLCSSSSPASDTIRVNLDGVVESPTQHAARDLAQSQESLPRQIETIVEAAVETSPEQGAEEDSDEVTPSVEGHDKGDRHVRFEDTPHPIYDVVEEVSFSNSNEESPQPPTATAAIAVGDGPVADAAPAAASAAGVAAAAEEAAPQIEEVADSHREEISQQDQEKLAAFLKSHGYTAADAKRKVKLFGYKYPLHSAVKANDAEMVRILMEAGANPAAKNSAGQTPKDFAAKVDKKQSHSSVIRALGGC